MSQKINYSGAKPQTPKPQYYEKLAIDPAEYATRNKLSFLEGCVVKRVTRHNGKDGLRDLQKARDEINMLIQYVYGGEES